LSYITFSIPRDATYLVISPFGSFVNYSERAKPKSLNI